MANEDTFRINAAMNAVPVKRVAPASPGAEKLIFEHFHEEREVNHEDSES